MTVFQGLRAWVILKRIAKALEESNKIAQAALDLDKERMAMEHPKWYQAGGKVPDAPKLTIISKASIDEWNERFREQHPEFDDRQI